jgi:hypothetical protein
MDYYKRNINDSNTKHNLKILLIKLKKMEDVNSKLTTQIANLINELNDANDKITTYENIINNLKSP